MSAQRMPKDGGAALVTVLVFLAVMSALAIVVVDAARFSTRRTANQSALTQARWYALGAESYAAQRVGELVRVQAETRIDESDWQGRAFTYPLDRGVMTLTLWDGANCFNLNSLVEQGDSGAYEASARGIVVFGRLLRLAGVTEHGLPAALADWIDEDDATTPGGAEDPAYGGEGAPYRTAGALLADVSELRAVRGFSDEIMARIAPYVCVRPGAGQAPLNVNALKPEQALLLSALFGDALRPEAAQTLIRMRPPGGWGDVEDFWRTPQLAGLEITEDTRALVALRSAYFVMSARVARDDMVETEAALIDASGAEARVVRRLFGAASERPML